MKELRNLLLDMNRKLGIDCPELRRAYDIVRRLK